MHRDVPNSVRFNRVRNEGLLLKFGAFRQDLDTFIPTLHVPVRTGTCNVLVTYLTPFRPASAYYVVEVVSTNTTSCTTSTYLRTLLLLVVEHTISSSVGRSNLAT